MVSVSRSLATNATSANGAADTTSRSHTVRPGETMYSLARTNGLSLEALTRANPQVQDPARLQVGQELHIPTATTTTPGANAAPTTAAAQPADDDVVTGARTRAAAADASVRGRLDAQVPASGPLPTGPLKTALTSTGTLRRNQEGPAISELQRQLNARGANLRVDGDFGRSTQRAVRDFQRAQGLTADGIVGQDTRAAFAATATPQPTAPAAPPPATPTTPGTPATPPTAATLPPLSSTLLRSGSEGPAVEALQQHLNAAIGAGLRIDGDFGRNTRLAVENFQRRAGLEVDGEVGSRTRTALREVVAGTRTLAAPSAPGGTAAPARPDGPRSRTITAEGNSFRVHDMQRREFGTRSVPGNRIISLDSNSASGRAGEILRPLVVIPNNATAAERRAAQASVDRVARWLADANPGDGRATTGIVRTTAQNGRGLSGFFHTEFHSVNDTDAVRMIRERPQEYARILADTLGSIPGANFIVPHGNNGDPGAVAVDGTSEVSIAQGLVRNGFFRL